MLDFLLFLQILFSNMKMWRSLSQTPLLPKHKYVISAIISWNSTLDFETGASESNWVESMLEKVAAMVAGTFPKEQWF